MKTMNKPFAKKRHAHSPAKQADRPPIDGVLNINKPAGMTSHDVVDAVRKAARMKKVGHTGTLDPMATGVLPLCLGRATKISQFLIAQDKEYVVELQLGTITDSQDITGTVLEEVAVPDELDAARIKQVLQTFEGEQEQIPPMVSAKHHKGKRLYELARQGVEVEREPCKIILSELQLLSIELPFVRFRVTCSKGTYIRTLCHDLGKAMGSGAVMAHLQRTRCGGFHLDEAIELHSLQLPDDVSRAVVGMNDALNSLPSITVGSEGKAAMKCGRTLPGGLIARREGHFLAGTMIRVNARDGTLLGVGVALMNADQLDELAGNLGVIRPVKVFPR